MEVLQYLDVVLGVFSVPSSEASKSSQLSL